MPARKCCCGICPIPLNECLGWGNSTCTNAESAEYYQAVAGKGEIINEDPDDPNFPDFCCQDIFDYAETIDSATRGLTYDGNCKWSTCVDKVSANPCDGVTGCGKMELEITSSTEATLTLERYSDGKKIIWEAEPGYDPLCMSLFKYDEEASTDPPTDCSWPKYMCVDGYNACCDDRKDMPRTLSVTFSPAPGPGDSDCTCSTGGTAGTLTFNHALAGGPGWAGTFQVGTCETYLTIEIRCVLIEGTSDCGGDLYEMEVHLSNCLPNETTNPTLDPSPGSPPPAPVPGCPGCGDPILMDLYIESFPGCCPPEEGLTDPPMNIIITE